MMVFSGNAHRAFAEECCAILALPLGDAKVSAFPDGETSVKLDDDIRGADVFIIQPTCPPVNQNLMELLIMIDCARRASARRITAVIPYFGYARQDRKDRARVPITAKLAANLIAVAGANRVLTLDLHAGQVQGFFDIPTDNLYGSPVLIPHILKTFDPTKLVVVTTDLGGVKMGRAYSRILEDQWKVRIPLAIINKVRHDAECTEVQELIGNVEGCDVLLVDDQISTGGSVDDGANFLLKEASARSVSIAATHAVCAGKAIERLTSGKFAHVIVTNTIPHASHEGITVVSAASLFAAAMRNIHNDESVSSLFVVRAK
ncbi:ribose-phosphate pyrophosphokinase [Candidatus Uhrbacteria bacterium]|nr:ribose-phosphate pyrophosphokinase [Candidatus Uhrbacteria bacterium]